MGRLVTAICTLGILTILGLNLWESAYDKGFRSGMGASNCAPIVVYRRGVDTLSGIELRRLAVMRERMEKTK